MNDRLAIAGRCSSNMSTAWRWMHSVPLFRRKVPEIQPGRRRFSCARRNTVCEFKFEAQHTQASTEHFRWRPIGEVFAGIIMDRRLEDR